MIRDPAHNLSDLLLDLPLRDPGPRGRLDREAKHGEDSERDLRLVLGVRSRERSGESAYRGGLRRRREVRRTGAVAARETEEDLEDWRQGRDEYAPGVEGREGFVPLSMLDMCPATKVLRSSSDPTLELLAQVSSACWIVGGYSKRRVSRRTRKGRARKGTCWVRIRDDNFALPLRPDVLLVRARRGVERSDPRLDVTSLDPSCLREWVEAVERRDDGDVRLVEAGGDFEAFALEELDGTGGVVDEEVVEGWEERVEEGWVGRVVRLLLLAPRDLQRRAVDDDVVVVLRVEGLHLE